MGHPEIQNRLKGCATRPYGTENTPASFSNTCSTNYKFTGYERDSETGLDYAFARYYSQLMFRFQSGDPLAGDIGDPQTLNRYSYTRNNPVNMVDPTGLVFGPLKLPVDGGPCIPCDVAIGILDIFSLFGLFGHHSSPPLPPPMPPPPSGAALSTLGCEMNGIPCGMQFPAGGGGYGGCTYGGGNCGGMIYGITAAQQAAAARQRILDYLQWLLSRPWMLSWIFPIEGIPGVAGVGPAGSIVYNPQTGALCVSAGIGASGGHNVAAGPLTKIHTNPGYKTDDIFSGGSLSGGANAPLAGAVGPGVQGTINQAGSAAGWDIGVAGLSASSTTGSCVSVK